MNGLVIRDLVGMGEFRLAEDLQNDVWGKDDTADPADLMMVIQAEGGLCAGAFSDGRLVGYVFAFPTRDPEVQHSHRLAIRSETRGLGLGARLKWYQRDWCLARGVRLVRWTFDPLRLLNASLNVGALGAVCRTYYPDYYGAMAGINAGAPSDRLLAEWFLDSPARGCPCRRGSRCRWTRLQAGSRCRPNSRPCWTGTPKRRLPNVCNSGPKLPLPSRGAKRFPVLTVGGANIC